MASPRDQRSDQAAKPPLPPMPPYWTEDMLRRRDAQQRQAGATGVLLFLTHVFLGAIVLGGLLSLL